jgi:hypothetical protein
MIWEGIGNDSGGALEFTIDANVGVRSDFFSNSFVTPKVTIIHLAIEHHRSGNIAGNLPACRSLHACTHR